MEKREMEMNTCTINFVQAEMMKFAATWGGTVPKVDVQCPLFSSLFSETLFFI